MNSSYDRGLYHPSHFDDDMCLKPPVLLWVAVIFLARAILLPVAIGIGHMARVDDKALMMLRSLWTVDGLFPAIVAAPVLYALVRRGPSAGGAARWIWAHGAVFLAASAGIDAARSFLDLTTLRDFADQAFISMGSGLIDLYCLAFVLMARRVRDSFKDFPPSR